MNRFQIAGGVSTKKELDTLKDVMHFASTGIHIRELPKHSIKFE